MKQYGVKCGANMPYNEVCATLAQAKRRMRNLNDDDDDIGDALREARAAIEEDAK